MSGFDGINSFGSLTTQNGVKLKFKDFDANGDGKITKEEYDKVLKDMNLDTVDLSTNDKNKDNVLSEDEFALWEQKIAMQDAVNNLAGTISKDFANDVTGIATITIALKEYIDEYASKYTGKDVAKMSEDFAKILPKKYETLKANIQENSNNTIKSTVLENMYNEILKSDSNITETAAKSIAKALDTEATKFIKEYKGINLEADLKTHLNAYMNQTDADKLKTAADTFKQKAGTFGNMIDSSELKQLKEYATEFLTAAVEAGVTIKLGGTNIRTTAAIKTALAKYSDGDELKSAIEDAIKNLSTKSLKDNLIAEGNAKATEIENKKFTDIKGSSYQVNAGKIDYSKIEGYFDGSNITVKKKKKTAKLKESVRSQLAERLENSLKPQMKQQIQQMLEAKGIPFEKIEQVFENIYNTSFTEVFNTDGMVSSKHKTWFKKGKASVNVKDFVNQFITTFNTNIEKAITSMNASDKDMDTIDLDFSQAGKDENGNAIKDETTGQDLSTLYASGKTITTQKHGADYYVSVAEKMVDRMKSQMLAKAKAMCTANGVEFDESVFNTMFNNAKSIAVNAAVTGITSKGKAWGATAGGTAGYGVGAAGAIGAATATSTYAGLSLSAIGTITGSTSTIGAISAGSAVGLSAGAGATSSILGISVASSAVPVIGWAAAGLGVVSALALGFLGNGHHSQSTLNTRTLLDTFAEQFKQNYTNWVNEEADKTKNK